MILAGAAAAKNIKMPYADRRKNKTAQRQRGNCTFQKAFEDSGADRKDTKKVAALNTAVLDEVAAHIRAGMSTAEIDKIVYDFQLHTVESRLL